MSSWPAKKNAGFVVIFPIYDNDGDIVTGAAALDSEISKDGGAFADCTNEAAEIGTSGYYALTLTATEMNADYIAIITKTSTTNAKTAANAIYTSVRQIDDLAFPVTSGRGIDVDASGGVEVGTFQAGALTSAAFAAGAIDANAIATDAISNAELSAAAITEIQAGLSTLTAAQVWDHLLTGISTAGSIGKLIEDYLDAAISTRSTYAGGDTAGTTTLLGRIVGTLAAGTHNPQSGDAYARLGAPVGASISADIAGVQSDTNDIQSRIPAALVSGRIDASVGAVANDAFTAAALAVDAVNEIADAVLKRDIDQVEGTAALHSLTTAILKAVSKVIDDAGTLKVYRTDGTTLHMSQTLTTDSNNEPIDSVGVGA